MDVGVGLFVDPLPELKWVGLSCAVAFVAVVTVVVVTLALRRRP